MIKGRLALLIGFRFLVANFQAVMEVDIKYSKVWLQTIILLYHVLLVEWLQIKWSVPMPGAVLSAGAAVNISTRWQPEGCSQKLY